MVFETVTLSEGFFVGNNHVNCAAPFSKCPLSFCREPSNLFDTTDQGKQAVYGTNDGVYMSNLWEPQREPVKVLALLDVTQVDVLEEYQLLIVLSGMSTCKSRGRKKE